MSQMVTLTLNPTLDKSTDIGRVLAEEKLRCGPPRWEPGGGGLNVSRAIQRLGGASLALYTAGGAMGALLQTLLDEEDLSHHAFPIEGWTRENLIVYETSTDRQFRFGMPGPELSEGEWKGCLGRLADFAAQAEYLVASGSLPLGVPDDFYARVAQVASRREARLIVDTSGEALRHAARAGVYLLKPNLRELKDLAEQEIEGEDDQEAAARALVRRGWCEVVVLSLGASGALLVTEEESLRFRSPVVPIKSRVGAGDSTVAGIVLGLRRGLDLREAVRFGIAAGAAAVMTPGTELCRREDTERLYEQMRASHRREA